MIEIRLCNLNEIDKLKEFISSNWKLDHILATHDELLSWQHFDTSTNKLNFVIGYDTLSEEILGILGFIPLSKFDILLSEKKDFWLAIWKVRSEAKGLGIDLLNFLITTYNPMSIGAIGINQEVRKLYKALKFKTGRLAQYYFLNPSTDIYRIVQVSINTSKKSYTKSVYKLNRLEIIDDHIEINHLFSPHKSLEYLRNRYVNHPIYNYQFYGIYFNDRIECIIIIRKIAINNAACLRIVDIYGDILNIGSIETEFVRLLNIENAEYIDCLNFGIPQDVFLNLGFLVPDDNVIPNYFEPFEPVNKEIEFAYLSKTDNYIIYKGDSDQDRPNLIKTAYEK
jgi:hypothetical protein